MNQSLSHEVRDLMSISIWPTATALPSAVPSLGQLNCCCETWHVSLLNSKSPSQVEWNSMHNQTLEFLS